MKYSHPVSIFCGRISYDYDSIGKNCDAVLDEFRKSSGFYMSVFGLGTRVCVLRAWESGSIGKIICDPCKGSGWIETVI